MTQLPLRELVLYKNGIGYFVREGQFEGETLDLRFQQDDINDILKSLSVFDHAGGQVLGIHYNTPVDAAVKLANNSIRLSDADSLKTLLRDLRGRQISAEFKLDEDQHETVRGQLIGIDIEEDATRLSVLREDGPIRVFKLDDLRDLTILDEQSAQDLRDFLASNQSESQQRSVKVQLSAGQHDLNVSYVAPSPNWRVSYRLLAETDQNEGTGEALLLGWGLFDNHIEDLEGVQVTLVAGTPISFQYDLYSSNIPERERVKDQTGVRQGPIDYRAAPQAASYEADSSAYEPPANLRSRRQKALSVQSLEDVELSLSFADRVGGSVLARAASVFGRGRSNDALGKRLETAAAQSTGFGAGLARRVDAGAMASGVASSTAGRDAGEVFQYVVTESVSVERGVSALVPIIKQPKLPYQRELLYNPRKLRDHPVAALRMSNSTGFTLERGPVTVVENGDYKGEAVVPFTRDGAELYVPYAVEQGIRVHHELKHSNEIAGRYVRGIELIEERHYLIDTTYTLENNTKRQQTVRIEANRQTDYDLIETKHPEETSAEFWRWSVTVPPNSSVEFKTRQRRLAERTEMLAGGCNPLAWVMARWLRWVGNVHEIQRKRNA